MLQKIIAFLDVDEGPQSIPAVLIGSVLLHILVLVVVPLLLAFFWKPEKFERPETIQLVTLNEVQRPEPPKPEPPTPEPKKDPKPEPKPDPKPKPAPKPDPKKKPEPKPEPTPEPEPEPEPDLQDLEDLFGTPAPKTSKLSEVGLKVAPRYLIAIKSKVEQNWNPTLRDSTISVIVNFSLNISGSLDGAVTIKKSSGKSVVDRQAIRAIELAAPFPSLPPNFKGSKLELNYTLIPYEG